MALVAYDNSSESEVDDDYNNDDRNASNGIVVLTKPDLLHAHATNNELPTIFSSLPPPKAKEHIVEEEDEFLFKKETPVETLQPNKRIKIDIPTLSYDSSDSDDDRPTVKKPKKSVSGLFALLPPPKSAPLSNTSFIPNVLKKKVVKPPAQSKDKRKISQIKEQSANIVSNANDTDSDGDIEIPDTFDDETWHKVCGKQKKPNKPQQPASVDQDSFAVEAAPPVEQPYDGLNNEAFKELVGSSKRFPRNIKLIDIHEDEIRPDKELWLKSLTDPNFEPEPVEEEPVDGTRKSRNHITALAQKALANDKELQMRWSENRFNRKQTQAKYGF